jgi:hypothetical protein
MLNLLSPLIQLFANEPLERLMYTIIIWSACIWFFPHYWEYEFNVFSGFQYAYQISVFSLAFVTALALSRLRVAIYYCYLVSSLKFREKSALKKIRSLSLEQLGLLEQFLRSGDTSFFAPWDNPHAGELSRLGIVEPVCSALHPQYISFKIRPDYVSLMRDYWNPCTKQFDKRQS